MADKTSKAVYIALGDMRLTVFTVDLVRTVSAVVVTITQVAFWDTQSAGRTLELTCTASCITPKHVVQIR